MALRGSGQSAAAAWAMEAMVPKGSSAKGGMVDRRDPGRPAETLCLCSDTSSLQDRGVDRLGDRRGRTRSPGVGDGRQWFLCRWKAPYLGRSDSRAANCDGAGPRLMTKWGKGEVVPWPDRVRRRQGRHTDRFLGCSVRVPLGTREG